MAKVAPLFGVAPPADGSAQRSGAPLYRQVCAALEELVMSLPLGDERALPTESQLMSRFGVSRGTLRRATDELARQGLLRIQAGRGTFVDQATKVRLTVWARLADVARPDSRFHLDLSRFVPDFDGRERCDERLLALQEFRSAATVFVAPDNSLEHFRLRTLEAGKKLLVPTYAMRRGFVLLDGARLPARLRDLAATLDGMERHGTPLSLDELRALGGVDLVVTGAVAVTTQGAHFGAGDGHFDLEWALLRHCNLATSRTPVVASVHSCQVLGAHVRPGPHDAVVDLIVTPDRTITCRSALPKPDGIFWDELTRGLRVPGPYLHDLLSAQRVAAWADVPSD